MRQQLSNTTALSLAIAALAWAGAAQAQQGDPLYRYQWHLMNYGQSVLGDTKPAFGIDVGIDDLHDYNIRGRDVVVGVVDEGLQIAHPDLAANVVPDGSRNFNTGGPIHDPSPTQAGEGHGTAVGGIIAAVGWNGIGVRGVAPAARLKGFNFLSPRAGGNQNDNIVYSWWDGAESKDVAVSNNSWGAAPLLPPAFSENEVGAFERPMAATRNGLGAIYVKAAGNHYNQHPVFFGLFNACTAETRAANVGCTQAGFDPRNNLFSVMTIAAVNAAGVRSNYSSPGSALWVSGLGGEYGHQKPYSTQTNPLNFDPAIVTTDVSGCVNGYNSDAAGARLNALDSSQSAIDSTCNYTGRMNGTSAATPTVAGVSALVLQANPKLGYRDVRYILAATARQIDPNQPTVKHANGTVIAPGWSANAAGHRFSNWYGYGLVDATAAVQRAMAFKPLPALIDSGWSRAEVAAPVAIGGASAPARLQVRIDRGIGKVEGVQLGLETTYPITAGFLSTAPSPLLVTLTSPSGTKSYVVPAMTGVGATTAFTIPFIASNAFLDETGDGLWTLEVADVPLAAGAASKGNLTGFKIRVLGH